MPKVLPNRLNIVLTKQDIKIPCTIVVHSKEELYELISNYKDEVMIIGGSSIYKMFIDDVDRMLLTEIEDTFPKADTYFPEFNKNNWKRKVLSRHLENNISYNHTEYIRK